MICGLHIEMTILKLLGYLLEDSGSTTALVQAEIASSGNASSFIHANHVTRSCHVHQVTAASLYALLHQAYIHERTSGNADATPPESVSFGDCCRERAKANVHFDYWYYRGLKFVPLSENIL